MRFLAIHDTTLASYLTGLVSKHLHVAPSGRAFIGAGRHQGKSYHAVIHVVSALAKDVVGSSCIKVRQWNSRTVEGIKVNRGMFPWSRDKLLLPSRIEVPFSPARPAISSTETDEHCPRCDYEAFAFPRLAARLGAVRTGYRGARSLRPSVRGFFSVSIPVRLSLVCHHQHLLDLFAQYTTISLGKGENIVNINQSSFNNKCSSADSVRRRARFTELSVVGQPDVSGRNPPARTRPILHSVSKNLRAAFNSCVSWAIWIRFTLTRRVTLSNISGNNHPSSVNACNVEQCCRMVSLHGISSYFMLVLSSR